MGKQIDKLIKECVTYFHEHSYSGDRVKAYETLWRIGIVSFMNGKGLTIYDSDVGNQFIDSISSGKFITSDLREKIRSIQVLNDYQELGYIRTKRTTPVEHPLFGEIGSQMQKHIENLQKLHRHKGTINRNRVYMNRFLVYLEKCGVNKVKDIQDRHIAGFLSSPETNNPHVISTLRVMFRFWHTNGTTTTDLTDSLIPFRPRRKEKIPSFYSKEEVGLFERAIDRTSGIGKRNYALFILASRLGLRASDIASLKFSNVDWENNEIRLYQYKTGNPISLPLLPEVGNAIIDYLKYGRRKSESQKIFLSERVPYGDITSLTVCAAISTIMVKSGVSIEGRRHGPHSLRHSLASRLLEQETPMPVISETLGHSTSQTTMGYLRIDITSLLKCSISIPCVPTDFYTQKGGIFYE